MPCPRDSRYRGAPPTLAPGRARRTGLLLVVFTLTALIGLTGCTRVRTALAVQGDDTVAGDIVIARAGGPPPVVEVPAALGGRVTVEPYHEENYQGSQLRFSDLRFDELNTLVSVAPQADGRFRFTLRRNGGVLILGGQVDLTAVPVDGADVQLKLAFPGEVVSSDGELDRGQLSWVFSPGQVSEFNAVISTPDPAAPSVTSWALLVGLIVAAAAGGVILLAWRTRNPPSRWSARRES